MVMTAMALECCRRRAAAAAASVEPVVASIVGILAFGEPMNLGVILGLICILISVYILR